MSLFGFQSVNCELKKSLFDIHHIPLTGLLSLLKIPFPSLTLHNGEGN